MNRTSKLRRAATLAAVTTTAIAVSVGGVASPAQALPPSAACEHLLRMAGALMNTNDPFTHYYNIQPARAYIDAYGMAGC
jgi:hypothetical protein